VTATRVPIPVARKPQVASREESLREVKLR